MHEFQQIFIKLNGFAVVYFILFEVIVSHFKASNFLGFLSNFIIGCNDFIIVDLNIFDNVWLLGIKNINLLDKWCEFCKFLLEQSLFLFITDIFAVQYQNVGNIIFMNSSLQLFNLILALFL